MCAQAEAVFKKGFLLATNFKKGMEVKFTW